MLKPVSIKMAKSTGIDRLFQLELFLKGNKPVYFSN